MAKKVTAALENSVAPPKQDLENDYETQNHLRTLIDAHGIMNDPDKMKKVHKLAGRHHKAISGIRSIGQLKELSNEKQIAKGKAAQGLDPLVDKDSDGE